MLPRMEDAKNDVLDVVDASGPDDWDMTVLDYRDAFKQIKVHKDERKHLAGKALGGVFFYRTILFGIKSGPLVWGRVAALLMRITAAVVAGKPIRLECFVDDPFITIGGTVRRRPTWLMVIVLLWLTLGFKLAWKKGSRGRRVEWIGVTIQKWTSATKVPGVTFTLSR